MKNQILNLTLVLILLVGLGLLLYPSFSDYWNSFRQSQVIAHYAEDINSIQDEQYEVLLQEAREWNADHANKSLSQGELEAYDRLLDPLGTGMMGYIEIPAIDCFLAIYHGTSESVLQIAVGHLEGTSFPVGGPGTHCVLTGHTGLPSAELFTRIDELREGDTFSLAVLGENLLYQIDQIEVVLPMELNSLGAAPGEDYCTLVTCTPYGINSHRLLVRGRRLAAEKEPEIEDPAKRAERIRLLQQMRSADMRYIKSGFMDRALDSMPIIGVLGAAAGILHFLRRKKRWEKWAGGKNGSSGNGGGEGGGHPKVLERFVPPAGSRDRGRDWWTGEDSKH